MNSIFSSLINRLTPRSRLYIRWTLLIICIVVMILVMNELNFRFIEGEELGEQFYTHWMATRLFLARGMDPYSDGVHQWILDYAREGLQWSEYQQTDTFFSQPIYGFLFYLPFVFINDFASAYAAWLTFLEFSLIFTSVVTFMLIREHWKGNLLIIVLGSTFILFSYATLQALIAGSVLPFSLLLFSLGVFFIKKEAYELAGVLLAFSTITVPVFVIPYLFILVWAYRQHYWNLIGWFIGSIFLLGISSALLFPNWVLSFAREWVRFFQITQPEFLNDIMRSYYPGTSGRIAFIIMTIAVILLLVEWGLAQRRQFSLFYWTLTLTVTLSVFLSPILNVESVTIILPIFFLISSLWIERWEKRGNIVAIFLWIMFLGYPWLLSLNQSRSFEQLRFWQIIPLLLFFALNLYWIRWWMIKNTDLWFDEYSGFDQTGQ